MQWNIGQLKEMKGYLASRERSMLYNHQGEADNSIVSITK